MGETALARVSYKDFKNEYSTLASRIEDTYDSDTKTIEIKFTIVEDEKIEELKNKLIQGSEKCQCDTVKYAKQIKAVKTLMTRPEIFWKIFGGVSPATLINREIGINELRN